MTKIIRVKTEGGGIYVIKESNGVTEVISGVFKYKVLNIESLEIGGPLIIKCERFEGDDEVTVIITSNIISVTFE